FVDAPDSSDEPTGVERERIVKDPRVLVAFPEASVHNTIPRDQIAIEENVATHFSSDRFNLFETKRFQDNRLSRSAGVQRIRFGAKTCHHLRVSDEMLQ